MSCKQELWCKHLVQALHHIVLLMLSLCSSSFFFFFGGWGKAGRSDQLRRVQGDDEDGNGLEDGFPPIFKSYAQRPQPQALQRKEFLAKTKLKRHQRGSERENKRRREENREIGRELRFTGEERETRRGFEEKTQ